MRSLPVPDGPGRLPDVHVRRLRTGELIGDEVHALRALFDVAFGGEFDDTDWEHATGGVHAIAEEDGRIVAHASVVPRQLEVGGRPVRAGYVEAVAADPRVGRRGLGSAVMREINAVIVSGHELGALSTGAHGFYERLGWVRWRGPSWVRTAGGLDRTEDDDDGLMVLPTPAMPAPDLDAPIVCEWREGDVW
jgi:aminoglycoside 2'-N-acetyltransferase I